MCDKYQEGASILFLFLEALEGLVATKDRLMQLIIKGILYESCVDFCQQKATGGPPKTSAMNGSHTSSIKFTNVLSPSDFSDSDLSLLSWLQVRIHLRTWQK